MAPKRVTQGRFESPTGYRSPVITLEVVSDPADLALGLMNRVQLAPHHGMLFVFPEPSRQGFWMKNTYIPLDIAWLDGQGYLLESQQMHPGDETMRYPMGPAQYALEMRLGTFNAYGLRFNDRLLLLR